MICFPFFHKYKVVNVQHGRDGDIGYPLTHVSYICQRCGKHKAKMIEGHFTGEDLKK